MRKIISIGTVLVMVLMGFTMVGGGAAATGTTWYVDDDGGADFTTIQAAVDNANSGDTIVVYEGTYTENVVVDKSLTLETASLPMIDGNLVGPCVTIAADGVTVDGFELTHGTAGVASWGTDNSIVSNNIIHDNLNVPGYMGLGIIFWSSMDDFDDNQLMGNEIYNNDRQGIYIGGTNPLYIHEGNTISGNTIYNNGLYTYPNGPDASAYGIQLSYADDNTIIDNEIYGHDDWFYYPGFDFAQGIYLFSSDHNHIEDNDLHDNNYGVGIWHYGREVQTNYINYNLIAGNTGYGLRTFDGLPTVDARYNWWGHTTGASHSSNPHGTGQGGDAVSDNVDFIPWYATETTTPLTEYVSVIHNPIIALSDTIQGGIDAALEGDTVQISSGTYIISTQILIDKGLSLLGDPVNNPIINAGNAIYPYMMRVDNSVTTPVNIANIVFDGVGQNVYGGLRLGGSNSGSVSGCTFQNIKYSTYLGFAIVLYGDSYLIENNVLSNIERVGIWIGDSTESNTMVKNNVYTGKGIGDWLDYGIEVGFGGIATIQGNTITDCTGVASSDGSTSAGILVTTYYAAGTQATIIENTIARNTVGIHVGYDSYDTSIVVANCNNILDNTDYGVYSTAPQVDATANWWGEISGPYHPTLNPTGTGDAVGDYIDFEPWSYRTDPCKPKSKGFWKTHLDVVEAILDEYGPIYLGDFAVENSEVAYDIFVNAKAKNANTMLAAELLATKLNILHFAHLSLDGSVSYWALDEGSGITAADSVGSNDGTINNGPNWVDGISGNALDFDGVDDHILVPNDSSLEPKFVSVEVWVKATNPGRYSYIVGKGGDTCRAVSYGIYTGGSGGLHFYIYDGSVFVLSPNAGTGVWDGKWHHIVGTFDGSYVRLYVDGSEVGSGTFTTRSIGYNLPSFNHLLIGGYTGPCEYLFKGVIDEVRIYNGALCPTLISVHYYIGLADQFLSSHNYNGPDDPGSVKGPDKQEALDLKDLLEAFNKGEGICS